MKHRVGKPKCWPASAVLSLKNVAEAIIAGLLVVLAFSLLVATCEAQTLDLPVKTTETPYLTLRLADDAWYGPDKVDHAIGGALTMGVTSILWLPDSDGDVWKASRLNLLGWAIWEVKDAILPWERYGWWGGDGASYRDWIWSAGGVALATGIVFLVRN